MQAIIGNAISKVADASSPAGVLLTQEEIALLQGEPNTDLQVLSPGQPDYSLKVGERRAVSLSDSGGPHSHAKQWAVGKYNLDPFVWFVHQELGAYSMPSRSTIDSAMSWWTMQAGSRLQSAAQTGLTIRSPTGRWPPVRQG